MLVVRLADDARAPMRGAMNVRRREAVDAEHFHAARGEVIERGAPHRTESYDYGVVLLRLCGHACTRRRLAPYGKTSTTSPAFCRCCIPRQYSTVSRSACAARKVPRSGSGGTRKAVNSSGKTSSSPT